MRGHPDQLLGDHRTDNLCLSFAVWTSILVANGLDHVAHRLVVIAVVADHGLWVIATQRGGGGDKRVKRECHSLARRRRRRRRTVDALDGDLGKGRNNEVTVVDDGNLWGCRLCFSHTLCGSHTPCRHPHQLDL